jgi:paraquat-inducible protein A
MSATASGAGLMLCGTCEQLNRHAGHVKHPACARCGAALHWRKPGSIGRSWAFLSAASFLYIPANTMPVMVTGSLFGTQADTILSGVVHLWHANNWVLAIILFTASIVLPGAKIASLGYLLYTAQHRSTWRPDQRAQLYRTMAFVGRWSMVDIFVGATLVALVQFRTIAAIEPGPGALAFAAVVVLTMLASSSFDPRLTWDPVDMRRG